VLTLGERVAWYAAAFDFVKNSLGTAMTLDKRSKTDPYRSTSSLLPYLMKRMRSHARIESI
jgi:hypothetical protein